jgi:hypothetical protein
MLVDEFYRQIPTSDIDTLWLFITRPAAGLEKWFRANRFEAIFTSQLQQTIVEWNGKVASQITDIQNVKKMWSVLLRNDLFEKLNETFSGS